MRILKIHSLPSSKKRTWVDRDEIMLHACFQILEDCVDKEKVDKHCDHETHKHFVDEVRFLYKWWKKRRKAVRLEESQMEEDDEMLIRLMKIRTVLWT